MRLFWITVGGLLHVLKLSHAAVDCFTCMVDFRSQPFDSNDACLYPREDKEKTRCNEVSRYCRATILRINGVFVQLQRTCEESCQETCTEKGYGIAYKECTFCCLENSKCGVQSYKSEARAMMSKDVMYILMMFYTFTSFYRMISV